MRPRLSPGPTFDATEQGTHALSTLRIGDTFLNAVTEPQSTYTTYIGQWAAAAERLKEKMESDGDFRYTLRCVLKSWMCY